MKRKALLIGGTGTISSAVTRLLSESEEWEVTLLNRGSKHDIPSHVKTLQGDIRSATLCRLHASVYLYQFGFGL